MNAMDAMASTPDAVA